MCILEFCIRLYYCLKIRALVKIAYNFKCKCKSSVPKQLNMTPLAYYRTVTVYRIQLLCLTTFERPLSLCFIVSTAVVLKSAVILKSLGLSQKFLFALSDFARDVTIPKISCLQLLQA